GDVAAQVHLEEAVLRVHVALRHEQAVRGGRVDLWHAPLVAHHLDLALQTPDAELAAGVRQRPARDGEQGDGAPDEDDDEDRRHSDRDPAPPGHLRHVPRLTAPGCATYNRHSCRPMPTPAPPAGTASSSISRSTPPRLRSAPSAQVRCARRTTASASCSRGRASTSPTPAPARPPPTAPPRARRAPARARRARRPPARRPPARRAPARPRAAARPRPPAPPARRPPAPEPPRAASSTGSRCCTVVHSTPPGAPARPGRRP